MNDTCNPRANGFNYGTGWGSSPKPKAYDRGTIIALHLAQIVHEVSAASWELEQALRAVRLAEKATEKYDTTKALEKLLERYEGKWYDEVL